MIDTFVITDRHYVGLIIIPTMRSGVFLVSAIRCASFVI
jgi:hypothetical protein